MTPYIYLNHKRLPDGRFDTNLDMIVGYRSNHQDEIGYAGFTYGPDCIVGAIGMTIGKPDIYDLGVSLAYMLHGDNGYGYGNILTPVGPEYFDDFILDKDHIDGVYHHVFMEAAVSVYMKYLTLSLNMKSHVQIRHSETDSNTSLRIGATIHL